ncbi:MAG: MFS transporter [Clostridia bacterium]|nr:MFS transporter [Clostridia bacterium]
MKISGSSKLIFLCWLAYTCSYVGKLSYSANINPIGTAFGVSYSETGLVATLFFFAYGVGQVVNGLLCKRYNVKYTVFAALTVGALMNLLIPLVPDFRFIKYIWLVNGAALSFLWTSLIRLLSETLPTAHIPRATVAMGTTVATGTFIIYGISSLLVSTLSYKITFYVAAAIMLSAALIWLFSYSPLVNPLLAERASEVASVAVDEKKSLGTIRGSLWAFIGVVALFAVSNNLIKDGLTTWTPDILDKIYGTPEWLSILLTLVLPLLGIFGAMLAIRIQKKTKSFILSCFLLFFCSLALIVTVLVFLMNPSLPVTVSCFALVSCFMASINNIVTSMIPLALKERMGSGKLAGVLNGFCYIGSTVSAYGLGYIATTGGWFAVFYVLIGVCALASAVGITYYIINRIKI